MTSIDTLTRNLLSRRHLLVTARQGTLSAAAMVALAGTGSRALAAGADPAADIAILNGALAAENQAIAAYQVAVYSGLLSAGVKSVALTFQGHHGEHSVALGETIIKLGGTPAPGKDSYDFPVASLKNEADVLRFAAGLERGAVIAYLSAVPKLDNREVAQAAASILGDEAMHWAVLRSALGQEPVPAAFMPTS